MANQSFFDKPKEQSLVKIEIVAKYFWAWAKIIINQTKKRQEIAYVDLFSGPGCYKDGSKSTPLLILERAISEPDTRKLLVTIFNDIDSNNTQSLQQAITALPEIDKLENKPIIFNKEVGEEIINEIKNNIKSMPTLFFIDPFGYKGLSINLIGKVINNWGSDCIFFFNYNRINMDLNNPVVKKDMNSFFGEERANALRTQLESTKRPYERELIIVETIAQALQEIGGTYVLPFCFKDDRGTRTSHHLVFVSKHPLGYSIMKEIMAKESSTTEQGVPSFDYNPATPYQPLLFEFSRPLDDLENMLLDEFAGQTIPMIEVYNQHHVGKRYIKANYKQVLLKLEAEGKITANPSKRRKNTLGDNVDIIFRLNK